MQDAASRAIAMHGRSRSFVRQYFGRAGGAPQDDAALRGADEVDRYSHLGAGQRPVVLDLLQRAGGVQLRLQQVAERALQLAR